MSRNDFNTRFDANEIEWDEHGQVVPVTPAEPVEVRVQRTREILATGLAECIAELSRLATLARS